MFGRSAAAASGNVEYAFGGHIAHLRGHLPRRLVIFAHLVGKTCVGVAEHPAAGDERKFFDQRSEFLRAQRTVEPEGPKFAVLHAMVKRLYGLPREGPAAAVADRYGHGKRQVQPKFVKGIYRRFHVERIEAGLDQNEVHSAFGEGPYLLGIYFHKVIEVIFPVSRVIDIRGEGKGLARRSHAACN